MNHRRSHRRQVLLSGLSLVTLTLAAGALGAGCSSSSSGSSSTNLSLGGTVTGTSGLPIAGATIYLVPASAVSTEEITGAGILAGTTEGFDEPLEDAVAAGSASFTQAVTDDGGAYEIAAVGDGPYFLYVAPAAADGEHLPGGNLCRIALTGAALAGTTADITLSSSPPVDAQYLGMSTCLSCHPSYSTEKTLAHRLGFRATGLTSGLQDISEHPEIDDGLAYFLEGDEYSDGTPVYFFDYDDDRGMDKFKTSLTNPVVEDDSVVYAILWLWQDDVSGKYKITINNVGNEDDENDLTTVVAQLTYGGAIHKQRYMVDWEDRNGLYPLLQFQNEGSEARYDRTRKVFRDYHLDFYWDDNDTPEDESDDLIKDPDITNNISRNCLGCHATGYEQYTDATTGEVLCDSREDIYGEYDIDGDGDRNDLNTGCESCHGPGSDHALVGSARYIITPENLSPSRSVQMCNRCHDRQAGADPIGGDHPLNADSEFPLPGLSRAEFLAEYVSRPGPAANHHWPDFTHAKSHHQQGPDFIKSAHYRNDNMLLVCADCHDMHGGTGHDRALVADPNAPDSPLCLICHGDDIGSTLAHTSEVIGVTHGPANATCIDCHMVKAAKTGSGQYGYLLSTPTGTSEDETEIYFENDISAHIFDVPHKDNVGVTGVLPQSAMPIPYTQSCAVCHDPSNLQHE
jgi:hypothetical protein